MKTVGIPAIRTAFLDVSAIAEGCLPDDLESTARAVARLLSNAPSAPSVSVCGNIISVRSAQNAVTVTVLDSHTRIALVLSGDAALRDDLSAHITSVAGASEKPPLTLLSAIEGEVESHSDIIDIFKALLPAIEQELTPYLVADARPTQVTLVFADGAYMVDRYLDSESLGCFFVQSENEREDAVLSDRGFEVIFNMQFIKDELMDADSENYLSSLISTVPHEIIHALNFANASRGLTPLEAYDCGLLQDIQDHYMNTTFGSHEKEERFTELTGLLIAKKLCTPDVLRDMARVSYSHHPSIRALCQ